jgi:hypothetical protein
VPKSIIEKLWFRAGCCAFIAACVALRVLDGLDGSWNAIRFARAYALAHGFDLYTPPDSGVISGLIYGPAGYLLYAPAALWTSPLPAIGTALLLSALATLGPAAVVLWGCRSAPRPNPWALPLFTVLVLHFYASAAMAGVWTIHTDAAALGLTCVALYWTLRHPLQKQFSWNLAAGAMCAALAVWSKQTTAPVLIVPGLYLLLTGCRRGAAWMWTLTVVFAGLLGVIFGALYGFNDLWLTMFGVPSGHERFLGAPLLEWRLITEFMEILYLLGIVLVGSIALRSGSERLSQGGSSERMPFWRRLSGRIREGSGWVLFGGMGLALFPMAFLGRMKVSGQANNFGLTDYFLALGIALAFVWLAARDEFRQGAGRRALEVSLVFLLAVLGLRTAANLVTSGHAVSVRWPPPIETAYAYAQKHPGTTYFPWHPLANLMANGRYDHTAWGVFERELAGFPVSESHLRAELPENLQRIGTIGEYRLVDAIQSRSWDHFVLRWLPEFRCVVTEPELPGWAVVERGPETCHAGAVADARGAQDP